MSSSSKDFIEAESTNNPDQSRRREKCSECILAPRGKIGVGDAEPRVNPLVINRGLDLVP